MQLENGRIRAWNKDPIWRQSSWSFSFSDPRDPMVLSYPASSWQREAARFCSEGSAPHPSGNTPTMPLSHSSKQIVWATCGGRDFPVHLWGHHQWRERAVTSSACNRGRMILQASLSHSPFGFGLWFCIWLKNYTLWRPLTVKQKCGFVFLTEIPPGVSQCPLCPQSVSTTRLWALGGRIKWFPICVSYSQVEGPAYGEYEHRHPHI